MQNIQLTRKFLNDLKLDKEFCNLPFDLKIATITLTCKFPNTKIDVRAIGYHMTLNRNDIVYVKYGPDYIRSLIKLKKSYNVKTKKKKNFLNQVSVMLKLNNSRLIHVKLFSNGSLLIAGCKTVYNFVEVMKILCKKLLGYKFVFNYKTSKTTKTHFVSNKDSIVMEKIEDLDIRLINSKFDVGFMIDRIILHNLLLKAGFKSDYDPCSHAGVNFKYGCGDITISVFAFESGSIIITGAKSQMQIEETYKFVVKFLYDNYKEIRKINMEKLLVRNDVKKLILSNL